jgi:hypothetical protein
MARQIVVHPGQRVIDTQGRTVIVAYVHTDGVWAYWNGEIVLVQVTGDAWGGEHDQEIGLNIGIAA